MTRKRRVPCELPTETETTRLAWHTCNNRDCPLRPGQTVK